MLYSRPNPPWTIHTYLYIITSEASLETKKWYLRLTQKDLMTYPHTTPLFDCYSIRPLQATDIPDLFTAIDTQRAHLGPWLPFVATTHRVEQTQEVVATMLSDKTNPVFTLRDGNVFAGLIGFKSASQQTRTIEIGYWLRSEQQGKGVMTAAVRMLCNMAFAEMGMRRVEIRCGVGNLRSNRIPQRLGFRLDGVEPRGEQLSDGSG